jgi:acyl carrier protein
MEQPADASPPLREGLPAVRPLGAPGPTHPAFSDGEAGQVMLQFQQLMTRFLETQQQVMLAYLRGSTDGVTLQSGVTSPAVALDVPIDPAPVPPSTRVEAPSSPGVREPAADSGWPPGNGEGATAFQRAVATAPPSAGREPQRILDREQLTHQLLQIVSERTGYPSDMLGLDLNIEADLGIDSIKRVEILGALQRAHPLSREERAQAAMEELTRIKTLRGIIDWICDAFTMPPESTTGRARSTPEGKLAGPASAQSGNGEADVPRFLLTAVDAPLSDQGAR